VSAVPDASGRLLLDLLGAEIDEVFNLPASDEASSLYATATPYPHLVIDDFVRPAFIESIQSIVLDDDHQFERSFTDGSIQHNKTISTGNDVPAVLQLLAGKLGSAPLLRWLERVSGRPGLVPDPYYNTDVGYYHIVGPGGVLASHLDHSHHATLGIPHVLNIVLYISPDWSDELGGRLFLYDRSGREARAEIEPRFNRAVVFACNPIAFHGVEPIVNDAPARHSLYFAYYLVEPTASTEGLPALQSRLGEPDGQEVHHPTYFVVPLRQLFLRRNRSYLRMRLEMVARSLLPPLVTGMVRKIRRRARRP
jgi:hypothetical protein